jgi:GTP cyclohydrolase II
VAIRRRPSTLDEHDPLTVSGSASKPAARAAANAMEATPIESVRRLSVAVDRASGDLRRGLPVLLSAGEPGHETGWLVLAAETASDIEVERMHRLTGELPVLAVPRERAQRLGLPAGAGPLALMRVADALCAEDIRRLADPTMPPPAGARPSGGGTMPDAATVAASIELAKLARLLPSVVLGPLRGRGVAAMRALAQAEELLMVSAADIAAYPSAAARALTRVGEALVPIVGAENCRIVAFRPGDGSVEHLAILVGAPAPDAPVLARVHSECFTGDLLGSLRCDCGDQLVSALEAIGRAGSGVLLYLAQEGRGIGLVNKLRAYGLQDRGADTIEANHQLGFAADERIYEPAAAILRQLGFGAVRLMTNNPAKVEALERAGIRVAERVPLVIEPNRFNRRYMAAKAEKLGHMF